MPLAPTDSPGYVSPAYDDMRPRWTMMRQVRRMNETIRKEGQTLLIKAKAEGPESFKARIQMTVAFEAVDETIHANVGLAMRHDPELGEDVPPRIKEEWEDIDGMGTHGSVFAQRALDDAIQDGHHAILVDYPKVSGNPRHDEEQRQGLRAYLVSIAIDRILAWRTGRVLGRVCLTMVLIEEPYEAPAGTYGSECVRRTRSLFQDVRLDGTPFVRWAVHEEDKAKPGEWSLIDQGILVGPKWIPLWPNYGGECTGILTSMPPLLGMAWTSVDHTQTTSIHAYSLYKTGIAIPVLIGRAGRVAGEAIVLSSDIAIDCDVGGDGKFMQGAGTALEPAEKKIAKLEARMGSQGFSMLRREVGTQQTLGEKEMQATREESKLARAVRSLQDALEGALGDMAAFYGISGGGGSVSMSRNFSDVQLSVEEMRLLIDLESQGRLTTPTLLREIKAGGRLLQGVDIEKEAAAVELLTSTEPMGDESLAPDGLLAAT